MNPVYDLLVEALDCADRLALADGSRWLGDAIARAYEVIELPDWLPQFETLVEAMGKAETLQRVSQTHNAPLDQLWFGGRFVPPPCPFREVSGREYWDQYGSWDINAESALLAKAEPEIAAKYAAMALEVTP